MAAEKISGSARARITQPDSEQHPAKEADRQRHQADQQTFSEPGERDEVPGDQSRNNHRSEELRAPFELLSQVEKRE